MIKQKSFKPYSIGMLPDRFIYPARYLELSENTETVQSDEYFQWWFVDSETDGGKLSYKLRNDKIERFNLVPLAKNGDWAAYFDGDDHSGDPKIVIIDLSDLPSHMICANFDEWLAKAEQDYW